VISRSSAAPALYATLLGLIIVLAALVLAARGSELVLDVPGLPATFTPNGDGEDDTIAIELVVRESDPDARVEIVGRKLRRLRTLAEHLEVREDQPLRLVWDGTTDTGARARPGLYRIRVVLPGSDRDMVFPRRIELRR
jgi:hypothetical protein